MTTSKKLEELTRRRDQLNAQIQAAKTKEGADRRKLETRAKVILGGVMLKMAKESEPHMERLKILIRNQVKRDTDKATFIRLGIMTAADFEREDS